MADHSRRYDVAALKEALAQDPRTAELGIGVRIDGNELFLEGAVTTEHHRLLIEAVCQETVPGVRIHDDIVIDDDTAASRRERLS